MKLARKIVLGILAAGLLVTGLGMYFALSPNPTELAQRDALRKLGVLVSMDGTGQYVSSANFSTLGSNASPQEALSIVRTLSTITSLDLSRSATTDADVETIKDLSSLASLSLSATAISDSSIRQIAHLNNLIALHLSDTKLTNAGLPNIASLGSLKILDLSGTSVTGDFGPLVEMPHLEWLVLSRLQLRPGAIQSLQAAPAIRRLSLKDTKFVADEIEALRSSHPGIVIDQ